jgi:hypothetical protein
MRCAKGKAKMKANNPCNTATVAEALERLPGPEGQLRVRI